MIRRLDAATETFLTDMAEIYRRLDRAQREITSGRRINTASDEPDQLTNLLQLRTELEQTEQIRSNLGRVKTEVNAAEQSLQAATKILDRAAVLGTQGASGTQTAAQRAMIAKEVETLLEQMVGVARTTVEARYVFSGDSDSQPPFTLDLTLDDPVSDYLGSAATKQVMHPTGTLFSVTKDGEEIFDNPDPSKNVFQAINSLRLGLRDDDQTAIEAALEQLRTAQDHLNTELAYYGTVQNQVAEAIDFSHKQELRLKTRLSEIQDTDMTEAILSLNQARYQQQVSLATKAKLGRVSLFDYLG